MDNKEPQRLRKDIRDLFPGPVIANNLPWFVPYPYRYNQNLRPYVNRYGELHPFPWRLTSDYKNQSGHEGEFFRDVYKWISPHVPTDYDKDNYLLDIFREVQVGYVYSLATPNALITLTNSYERLFHLIVGLYLHLTTQNEDNVFCHMGEVLDLYEEGADVNWTEYLGISKSTLKRLLDKYYYDDTHKFLSGFSLMTNWKDNMKRLHPVLQKLDDHEWEGVLQRYQRTLFSEKSVTDELRRQLFDNIVAEAMSPLKERLNEHGITDPIKYFALGIDAFALLQPGESRELRFTSLEGNEKIQASCYFGPDGSLHYILHTPIDDESTKDAAAVEVEVAVTEESNQHVEQNITIPEKYRISVESVFLKTFRYNDRDQDTYRIVREVAQICLDPNEATQIPIFIHACYKLKCSRECTLLYPRKVVDALIGLGILKFKDETETKIFSDKVGRKNKRFNVCKMNEFDQTLFDTFLDKLQRACIV